MEILLAQIYDLLAIIALTINKEAASVILEEHKDGKTRHPLLEIVDKE